MLYEQGNNMDIPFDMNAMCDQHGIDKGKTIDKRKGIDKGKGIDQQEFDPFFGTQSEIGKEDKEGEGSGTNDDSINIDYVDESNMLQ